MSGLAGVVLAAGAGTRLRPLTYLRPKPLCPVANMPLVDHGLRRITPYVGEVAVNVHSFRDQLVRHLDGRAHVSIEDSRPLGTAGALGKLKSWIDGRDVLLTNADSYLEGGLRHLVEGWDGERPRLLVRTVPGGGDFGDERYLGACLLPWRDVAMLEPVVSGLYEVMWRDMWGHRDGQADGSPRGLELVPHAGVAIDCGTPADYLRANLHASGGASVVGPGAVVEGEIVRSVVWPGCHVAPGERLVEQVRADSGLTVDAHQ